MSSWKKYGGVNKPDHLNSLSVYSFAADLFTLRQAYYGAFDICGELHVSGDATSDGTIRSNNLIVRRDIYADRLFVNVYTLQYASVDVSGTLAVYGNSNFKKDLDIEGKIRLQKQLYLGNSSNVFALGTSSGNLGINTNNPFAAVDISSAQPFAFNVGTSSQSYMYSIPVQNKNSQGIVMTSNIDDSSLKFFVDNSILSGNAPDGLIHYARGGYLTVDVSENTNILSKVGISNRGNAQHILNETVVVYDISSTTPHLNLVYENASEKSGKALTLVANDASSITFLNLITPNKQGVAFGGGVYPNDQLRSMGSIGCLDVSANYTPSINIVSGNSKIRQKTTVGINNHAPSTEYFAFDVNGPIHVSNGELTIVEQPNFEILALAAGKTARSSAIAVGTPISTTYPYRVVYLQTKNGGEKWNYSYDLFGNFIEENAGNQLNCAFVYDSNLTLTAGGVYAYYSQQGATPYLKAINLSEGLQGINSIYACTGSSPSIVRVFLGCQTSVHWFDMSYSSIYNSDPEYSISSNEILEGSFSMSAEVAMDGIGTNLWIVDGSSISLVNALATSPSVSTKRTNNRNLNYNGICAFDSNNVVAVGSGIITYTNNAASTWTDISLNYQINNVSIIDVSNAIAVCNGGVILYSKDGYKTWNPIPQDILNSSGNAARISDPGYNLTSLGVVDINNFYITKKIQSYSLAENAGGITSLFHVYLPGLFNNSNNYVLDISGSTKLSGDMMIVDGGKIASTNDEFSLLNNNVSKIYFGNDASSVFVGGSKANSNVIVNSDLLVLNNSQLNGKLTVFNQTTLANTLSVGLNALFYSNIFVANNTTVNGNSYVNKNANITGTMYVGGVSTIAANLNVLGNTTVQGLLYISGNATLASNLIVLKNATLQGSLQVAGNATISSNITVLGNATINNAATVQGVLYVAGNATIASNLNVLRNANLSKQLFVGETLYVVGNATMASNLQASNVFITNLTVSGNATMTNNLNILGNANVAKTLYVSGDATLASNFRLLGNTTIAKNATISGEVITMGNITANQNVYALNTVYATNYDGVPTINAGSLTSDLTMGLSVPGLSSRMIKIGNFLGTGTVNNIFIGGGQDVIIMGGTVINNQSIKAGPILYLNTPILNNGMLVGDNSSVGSGIVIADSGNSSVGYITVPSDKSGFVFRPTDPDNNNVVKFDVKNSVLPESQGSGIMTLTPSAAYSDSTYTMVVGSINPDNIILGNKSLATPSSSQVIDSSVGVSGHISIGSSSADYSQSECSLEVHGNIYQTNGIVWQF